jgi:hypothetical protein
VKRFLAVIAFTAASTLLVATPVSASLTETASGIVPSRDSVSWYGPAKMGTVAGVRMPICAKPKIGLLSAYPTRSGTGIRAKKTMRVKFQQGTRLVPRVIRKGTLVCRWTGTKASGSAAGTSGSADASGVDGATSGLTDTTRPVGTRDMPFAAPTMTFVRSYAFHPEYTSFGVQPSDWMVAHEFVLGGGSYVINTSYLHPRRKPTSTYMLVEGGDLTVTFAGEPKDLLGRYPDGWVWDPSQGCTTPYGMFEIGAPGYRVGEGATAEVTLSPDVAHALAVQGSLQRGTACPAE